MEISVIAGGDGAAAAGDGVVGVFTEEEKRAQGRGRRRLLVVEGERREDRRRSREEEEEDFIAEGRNISLLSSGRGLDCLEGRQCNDAALTMSGHAEALKCDLSGFLGHDAQDAR
eukprot:scaffold8399_cov179-Ochromonas_danica.AAC.3